MINHLNVRDFRIAKKIDLAKNLTFEFGLDLVLDFDLNLFYQNLRMLYHSKVNVAIAIRDKYNFNIANKLRSEIDIR